MRGNVDRIGCVVGKTARRNKTCLVDEILQILTAKIGGAHTENKTDGIHRVTFAASIWTDDRIETKEGPYGLAAAVTLEVQDLDPENAPHRQWSIA